MARMLGQRSGNQNRSIEQNFQRQSCSWSRSARSWSIRSLKLIWSRVAVSMTRMPSLFCRWGFCWVYSVEIVIELTDCCLRLLIFSIAKRDLWSIRVSRINCSGEMPRLVEICSIYCCSSGERFMVTPWDRITNYALHLLWIKKSGSLVIQENQVLARSHHYVMLNLPGHEKKYRNSLI